MNIHIMHEKVKAFFHLFSCISAPEGREPFSTLRIYEYYMIKSRLFYKKFSTWQYDRRKMCVKQGNMGSNRVSEWWIRHGHQAIGQNFIPMLSWQYDRMTPQKGISSLQKKVCHKDRHMVYFLYYDRFDMVNCGLVWGNVVRISLELLSPWPII